MGNMDSVKGGLSIIGRLVDAAGYCIPALVGLLMVAWGVFLDTGNWVLIIIGLALFLGFGYYTYKALTSA